MFSSPHNRPEVLWKDRLPLSAKALEASGGQVLTYFKPNTKTTCLQSTCVASTLVSGRRSSVGVKMATLALCSSLSLVQWQFLVVFYWNWVEVLGCVGKTISRKNNILEWRSFSFRSTIPLSFEWIVATVLFFMFCFSLTCSCSQEEMLAAAGKSTNCQKVKTNVHTGFGCTHRLQNHTNCKFISQQSTQSLPLKPCCVEEDLFLTVMAVPQTHLGKAKEIKPPRFNSPSVWVQVSEICNRKISGYFR